jgi:hypothetical protein
VYIKIIPLANTPLIVPPRKLTVPEGISSVPALILIVGAFIVIIPEPDVDVSWMLFVAV